MLSEAELQAVRLSLAIALRSVVLGLPPAIAVAWLLARGRFVGKGLLDALVHVPLVLPPVVTGYLLLLVFGVRGPLGQLLEQWFGVRLVFTAAGATLATAVMTFPLQVRAIRLALELVDPGLEAAARTLGAGAVDRFVTVTLPLMLPGIVSAAIVGFAAGLGEFGAVITFASNVPGETQTLPLAIYAALQSPGGDAVAARLAFVSFALALAGLILAEVMARRVRRLLGALTVLEVALRHRLGAFEVDAAFTAASPGVTALFGPSGAGKTTIVDAIAGLLRPREGRIAIDGVTFLDTVRGIHVPAERRRVGYVFQDARLFPHLGVAANLRYGLARAPAGERRIGFDAVVALLGIAPLLERRPHRLSGGERQRVALGRALLAQPRVLLMDEPLAALDAERRQEVLPYFERLRAELALPIVYVSHAMAEVVRLADTLVLVDRGRTTMAGPLDELSRRTDLPVFATRFGAGSVFEARVAGHDAARGLSRLAIGGATLLVPLLDVPVGARRRVRVRARDVILATVRPEGVSVRNILPGRLVELRPMGEFQVAARIEFAGGMLLAQLTRDAVAELALAPGGAVHALIKSVAVDAAVSPARESTSPPPIP